MANAMLALLLVALGLLVGALLWLVHMVITAHVAALYGEPHVGWREWLLCRRERKRYATRDKRVQVVVTVLRAPWDAEGSRHAKLFSQVCSQTYALNEMYEVN